MIPVIGGVNETGNMASVSMLLKDIIDLILYISEISSAGISPRCDSLTKVTCIS